MELSSTFTAEPPDVAAGEVILKADGLTIDPNVLGSDGTVWYNRSIPSPECRRGEAVARKSASSPPGEMKTPPPSVNGLSTTPTFSPATSLLARFAQPSVTPSGLDRRYLSNGNGTLLSYARRLEERQVREYQIYLATKNELEFDFKCVPVCGFEKAVAKDAVHTHGTSHDRIGLRIAFEDRVRMMPRSSGAEGVDSHGD